MSTGHRDGQCNLRPSGEKQGFPIKKHQRHVKHRRHLLPNSHEHVSGGKRIIKLLILTIKQFKLICIFADCTVLFEELSIRYTSSPSDEKDVNMRFQRWQLFDFPAWKFPSTPENILDNEKWGNFLVDFSLKLFFRQKFLEKKKECQLENWMRTC